jgi:hypothetical protein
MVRDDGGRLVRICTTAVGGISWIEKGFAGRMGDIDLGRLVSNTSLGTCASVVNLVPGQVGSEDESER